METSLPFWSRYRSHNYVYPLWQTFLYLLLWFVQDGVDAVTRGGFDSFTIQVHKVRPSSVEITWTSSDNAAFSRLAVCDIVIWSSNDETRSTLDNYSLHNHIITIKFLKETTHYALFLFCHINNTSYSSNIIKFETGNRRLISSTTNPSTVVTQIEDGLNKTHLNCSMNHSHSTDGESPTIYKQKLNAFSNVLDATLGIVFAVIGSIVAIVTLCYVYKSCRRRQRVQRFMRQEENSDQFAIIRQNISESS